jgi:hypothetical protein
METQNAAEVLAASPTGEIVSMSTAAVRRWNTLSMIAVVLFVIGGIAVFVYAGECAQTQVTVPAENRRSFARVAVLIDGTNSVGTANFALIKRIVREKILPGLGPNDAALGYDVRPGYSTTANSVFGLEKGDQMPQDPPAQRRAILGTLNATPGTTAVTDGLRALIGGLRRGRDGVEGVRRSLDQAVQKRTAPTLPGSDICHPVQDLVAFLRQGDAADERWLFLLSDLHDTSNQPACHLGTPPPDKRWHVVWIFTFDAGQKSWPRIPGYWNELLVGRNLAPLPFSSALAGLAAPLLPSNPTAGLEGVVVKDLIGCARPFLGPLAGLLLLAVAAELISVACNRWRTT